MRLNTREKVLFSGIFMLGFAVAGYLAFRFNDVQDKRKEEWATVVNEFNDCVLDGTLFKLGYRPTTYNDDATEPVAREWYIRNPLVEVLTSGIKDKKFSDLDKLWIDPEKVGAFYNKKPDEVSESFLARCEAKIRSGYQQTWIDLGRYYLMMGHPSAFTWLNKAGEADVADAYVLMGHAYRRGLVSTIKDEKQAFHYYMKAARMGSTKGQLYVGELLKTADPEQARRFFNAAAEGGSLAASYHLQNLNVQQAVVNGYPKTAVPTNKEIYFWNLVFSYLNGSRQKKSVPEAFYDYSRSPNIEESEHEFEYDGLPATTWKGGFAPPPKEAKVVTRFDPELARRNQVVLESELDYDSRVAVQDAAKKWVETRVRRVTMAVADTRPDPKPWSNRNLPPWKTYPLAICEAKTVSKELSATDLFKKFKPYIWTVTTQVKGNSSGPLGAAVALAPNLLATNCHVISGYEEIVLTQDKATLSASLVAADIQRDICMLEVKAKLPFVTNSLPLSKVEIGQTAYTLGFPQGQGLTFANGIISGIRRAEGREFVQTTAPIGKGSSGGALIDSKGNLMGLTAFYLQSGQALNYAITANDICSSK
jgi:S1-C subfamily serine protease